MRILKPGTKVRITSDPSRIGYDDFHSLCSPWCPEYGGLICTIKENGADKTKYKFLSNVCDHIETIYCLNEIDCWWTEQWFDVIGTEHKTEYED